MDCACWVSMSNSNGARAVIEFQKQIFCAALQVAHSLSAQQLTKVLRDRPAQLCVADDDVCDDLSGQMGGEAAQSGFDFGEFGHGSNKWGKAICPYF